MSPSPPVYRSMQADKSRNVITRAPHHSSGRVAILRTPPRVNRIRSNSIRAHEVEADRSFPSNGVYSTTPFVGGARIILGDHTGITFGVMSPKSRIDHDDHSCHDVGFVNHPWGREFEHPRSLPSLLVSLMSHTLSLSFSHPARRRLRPSWRFT